MTSPTSTEPPKTLLFVLGMHRSGTSALTRVLSLLGARLPSRLMEPNEVTNPRGFWESLEVAEINEELLKTLGRSWTDPRSTPTVDPEDRTVEQQELYERSLNLVRQEFASCDLAVIKDPRICRLVPWWRSVAVDCGLQPRFVMCLRRPDEVAASLARRDGFGRLGAEALWLRYVLEAEAETRDEPRAIATYGLLLEDWRRVAANVAKATGVAWPVSPKEAEPRVAEFLSRDLRNHTLDSPERATPADEVYQILSRWADTGSSSDTQRTEPDRLAELKGGLEDHLLGVAPWIAEYEGLLLNKIQEKVAVQSVLLSTSTWSESLVRELKAHEAGTAELEAWSRDLESKLQSATQAQEATLDWVLEILDEAMDTARSATRTVDYRAALEARASAVRRQRQEARVERDQMSEEASSLRAVCGELTGSVEALRKESSALQSRLEASEAQLEVSGQQLRSTQDEAVDLRNRLTEIQIAYGELAAHAARLQEKVDLVKRFPLVQPLWRWVGGLFSN